MKNDPKYYRICKSRREYLGIRYFKFYWDADKVVQVCVNPGDVKKGKSNTYGVYLISKMTFISNYFGMGYAEPCSKTEYEKNFNTIFEYLK